MDVGLSMAFVGVMSVAVQGGLLRIVIPKFGPVRCAYFGIVATAAAFIGVATAGSSWALYFWCGVFLAVWQTDKQHFVESGGSRQPRRVAGHYGQRQQCGHDHWAPAAHANL